ncbi:hypothetical protein D3C73_952890 [compost metagenome]
MLRHGDVQQRYVVRYEHLPVDLGTWQTKADRLDSGISLHSFIYQRLKAAQVNPLSR